MYHYTNVISEQLDWTLNNRIVPRSRSFFTFPIHEILAISYNNRFIFRFSCRKYWHRAELHETWKSGQAATFTIREPDNNCRLKTIVYGYLRISAVCLTAKDILEFSKATPRNHFVRTRERFVRR